MLENQRKKPASGERNPDAGFFLLPQNAGSKFFGWGVVSLGKITYNVILGLKIITHGNGSFGLRNMPRQRGKMKEIKDDFYHGQQTVSGICFG